MASHARRGSILASLLGVRSLVLAPLFVSGCLVTEISPEPNTNQPPRILLPGDVAPDGTPSSTSDPYTVYYVSPSQQLMGVRTVLQVFVDVTDVDDDRLEYNVFVHSPSASTGFDAGTSTTPKPARLNLTPGAIDLSKSPRATLTIIVPGDKFFDTVRSCYRVEVRVSSDLSATDDYVPVRQGDLATISFWVGSVGNTTDIVDLASCRRQ